MLPKLSQGASLHDDSTAPQDLRYMLPLAPTKGTTKPRRRGGASTLRWWPACCLVWLMLSGAHAQQQQRGAPALEPEPLDVNVSSIFPPPRRCTPESSQQNPICTIAILHYRKLETPIESFEVGFQASVREIEKEHPYRFTWVNVALLEGLQTTATSICEYLSSYEHYWVKSNWEWVVDRIARLALYDCPVTRSLLISGTRPPPSEEALHYYHALYYETHWYHGFAALDRHPLAVHAFGIDTNIMNREAQGIPVEVEPSWDYLVITQIAYNCDDKRTLKILEKTGRRLLIGSSTGEKAQALESTLRDNGVHIHQVMSYNELANAITTTRVVYVPDNVFGGGERAVLEARAMGVAVEVEEDSPKLQELLRSPIYNQTYYAAQLVHGLRQLSANELLYRQSVGATT